MPRRHFLSIETVSAAITDVRGTLADRMLSALEAAEAASEDVRGSKSAALRLDE